MPADAEKLSTSQLRDTHVPQPGAGRFFARSTMLIGSRGSGKTFLLRHRKATEHRGALYINLPKTLSCIGRDTGLGGRAVEIAPDVDASIQAKTAALVAIAVVECAADECSGSLPGSLSALDPVLPSEFRVTSKVTTVAAADLRRRVQRSPLSDWNMAIGVDEMSDVISSVQRSYPFPLTLFLDRAEDVTRASIAMLIEMLDQSVESLVVIAGRPAIGQLIPRHHNPTFVPGDHFDLLHLGADPYSDEWQGFSLAATANYLYANNTVVPRDIDLAWASRMARDSVRGAVAFAQVALGARPSTTLDKRAEHVRGMQEQQLKRVRASMAPDFRDFAEVLDQLKAPIRTRLAEEEPFGVMTGVSDGFQLSLIGETSTIHGYLQRGIRADAFCFPPGETWHPYEMPSTFELAPILAWDGQNPQWIS